MPQKFLQLNSDSSRKISSRYRSVDDVDGGGGGGDAVVSSLAVANNGFLGGGSGGIGEEVSNTRPIKRHGKWVAKDHL